MLVVFIVSCKLAKDTNSLLNFKNSAILLTLVKTSIAKIKSSNANKITLKRTK